MTKIYEALEQAEKDSAGDLGLPGGSVPAGDITGLGPTTPVERTLIGLYQSISAALGEAHGKVVEFVGPTRATGASPLLSKFAQVVARKLEKSVLYVSVSETRPGGAWGITPAGLLNGLVDPECTIESVTQQVGNIPLYVGTLGSGAGADTTGFIDSPRFRDVLDRLRERFDTILLDPPAFNYSPEGLALAGMADGVVLVVEAERTRWQVAHVVKDRIERQGGKILGAILNKRRHYIPGFIYKRL